MNINYRLILPKLLSLFTGPRYLPAKLNFGDSWTNNFFRTYEWIFFRRCGIRKETSYDSKGNRTAHTLEAKCFWIEEVVRGYFKSFKIIRLPVYFPVYVGIPTQRIPLGYMFAIARGTATIGNRLDIGVASSTQSFSASSGSDNFAIYSLYAEAGAGVDPITSVTYAAAAMTLAVKIQRSTGTGYQYSYYKINPATGANDATANFSPNATTLNNGFVNYTGVDQTSPIDATASSVNGSGNTTLSTTLTVVASNCWAFNGSFANNGSLTFTAGITNSLGSPNAGGWGIADTNGTIGTGGNTVTIGRASAGEAGITCFSFKPSVAVTEQLSLLTTGVGS